MSEEPGTEPQSNVYTMLLIAATLIVVGATVFLTIRSQELFGSWNPFEGA